MRWAMVRSSLEATPGSLATTVSNSRGPRIMTRMSERAVTVAARRRRSAAAPGLDLGFPTGALVASRLLSNPPC